MKGGGNGMEDRQIIELYWQRSERAIAATRRKYEKYCRAIAHRILRSAEDTEECLNDTYLKVWNSVPPRRPQKFSAFLAKVTRNLALDRVEKQKAAKRGGGQVPLAWEELKDCIPCGGDPVEDGELKEALERFLRSLPAENCTIFMKRYWYLYAVKDIAKEGGFGESKVKMILLRTRNQLKEFLEEEGIDL